MLNGAVWIIEQSGGFEESVYCESFFQYDLKWSFLPAFLATSLRITFSGLVNEYIGEIHLKRARWVFTSSLGSNFRVHRVLCCARVNFSANVSMFHWPWLTPPLDNDDMFKGLLWTKEIALVWNSGTHFLNSLPISLFSPRVKIAELLPLS